MSPFTLFFFPCGYFSFSSVVFLQTVFGSPLRSAHAIRPMTLTMTHLYLAQEKKLPSSPCDFRPDKVPQVRLTTERGPSGRTAIHWLRALMLGWRLGY